MLKIFETNNKYRIGQEKEDFDSINFDDLSGFYKNEIELVKLMEDNGAIIEYYDFRKDRIATREDYLEHFNNYDSDENYILPNCTFNNFENAKKVLSIMLKEL